MSELVYLDTNIYISYFRQETDSLRPLGDFAFELLRKTLSCSYTLVLSSWVLTELSSKIDERTLSEFVFEFKKQQKVVFVGVDESDFVLAKSFPRWPDRLHELLAHKAGARYLVTRNMKDFVGDLVELKFPENL